MKLSRAYVCVQCNEVFEAPFKNCCPSCTNSGIMPAERLMPDIKLTDSIFRVNFDMHAYDELRMKFDFLKEITKIG